MSFWFVIAALVFVIAIIVLIVRINPGAKPEPRPSVPDSFAIQNDPRELLEGLPQSVRLPLERMLVAHGQLGAVQRGSSLPAQATDLIAVTAPLALEVARLEDYLGRFDLRQVVLEAQSNPSRRVLLADLERMGARHDVLMDAITSAAVDLEAVRVSELESARFEAALHRLRLL
jgi:hypothetical protein